MNDRYLYKAKKKNWRELPTEMWWVEGYLYGIWERRYILWGMTNDVPNMVEVDPSTICQCTGLKDKNGKLIWENDVVRVKYTDGQEEYQENAKVSYTKRGFSPFSWEYYCDGCDVRCEILEIEVTGNIFDEGSENIGKGAEEN